MAAQAMCEGRFVRNQPGDLYSVRETPVYQLFIVFASAHSLLHILVASLHTKINVQLLLV